MKAVHRGDADIFVYIMKIIRYFRFVRIQTYRIFYFYRRLFAKHQTLSFKCWIVSSRSRSHKTWLLSKLISKFFVYCCHSNIDFT